MVDVQGVVDYPLSDGSNDGDGDVVAGGDQKENENPMADNFGKHLPSDKNSHGAGTSQNAGCVRTVLTYHSQL